MRLLRLVPALLVIILLSACNEKLIEQAPSGSTQEGEVVINLHSDSAAAVKSGGDDAVNVDDFLIEIFNSGNIRLFSGQYNSKHEYSVRLNAGEYRLLAKLGDSLGVGFDKPFYMADKPFAVHGQTKETVDAIAFLANVKTAVAFGENIRRFYSQNGQCYAVVRHGTLKDKSLKFVLDETRAGYIPAGELVLEVYAKIDGIWKYFAAPAETYSPRDFVTFTVDTGVQEGTLTLNVRVDNTVDVQEKHIDIPSAALAALPPAITPVSFDAEDCYCVVEGQESAAGNVSLSFSAHSGIKSCVLSVKSDLLDVPESVDLCMNDAAGEASLEKAGFFWVMDNIDGVLDISGILPALGLNSVYKSREESVVAELSLVLTDVNDRTAERTVCIKVGPDASARVIVPEHDVWARRIAAPHIEIVKANMPSLVSLQYSTDGSSWISAGDASRSEANVLEFDTVDGLEPATEYRLRAVYDGWCVISDVVTVRTEEAAQVGNAGFEEWTAQKHTFTPEGGILGGGPHDFDFYRPWISDKWWDVNGKISMPSTSTGWTSANIKCFPCTGKSSDRHSGANSALALVVNVGGANTEHIADGTDYIGEIYIGTSDDSGNHKTEAHPFSSRPAKLKFYYKYLPKSNENFVVKVELKAADGTLLSSSEVTVGAASVWTEYTLPFNYGEPGKKASQIYISFKASSHATGVNPNSKIEMGGKEYTGHFGSQLRIDDVELIYE